MGFNMIGLSLGCYQRLAHRLSHAQKLGLKQLLLVEQRLKHPTYPNTVKGLEGIQTAHEILTAKEYSGVLIGGLAEAVWNQRRKPEELYDHKDVDVMVLEEEADMEKFEGGVDWWLKKKGKITLKSEYGDVEHTDEEWYENGNGVVLSFRAKTQTQLPPGLYIPDCEWVIDMRKTEAESNIDYGRVDVQFDDEVFKSFENHIKKRVKTRLPKFIRELFEGRILSYTYEDDYRKVNAVVPEGVDLQTKRGILGSK